MDEKSVWSREGGCRRCGRECRREREREREGGSDGRIVDAVEWLRSKTKQNALHARFAALDGIHLVRHAKSTILTLLHRL